jgi:hypothetical protein
MAESPPPVPVLDTVNDAELEANPQLTSYVRTGYMDNIDLADSNDPDALIKVLPYLPSWHTGLSDYATEMKLIGIRVRPDPRKLRRVLLWLRYETNVVNLQPTAYMLRDRTFTVQRSDFMIPGLNEVMRLGFDLTGTTLAGEDPDDYEIPKEPVFLNMDMSARSLQLTVLRYGRPESGGAADFHNHVNDDDWPVGGFAFHQNQTGSPTPLVGEPVMFESATSLPKGYWRLAQYSTEFDRNRGMTLVQAEAVTKVIEDWSQYAMARHERSGKFPFGSLSDSEVIATIAAMNAPVYSHGTIYPTGATAHRGIGRFGRYPLTNFENIFGF